ncbi:putative telomere-associated RecQ helicase [Aspergillus affinis]|uniref:putative telomere-associated RecQ helicase n=1 Tax=Aspergillus affinis TaxID=1070780 RepID=UPI0022FDC2FC|nr:telomere-associated RecQ helicase [Aspergillus affinis]KAI9035707.1 telomere-associated RecQ helicase [Aspergillus affinis]
MTSGGPARGSKITQILFQNTAGTQRNLFLHPETKLFVIRLAYSKTFSRTGIEKDALRVVPSGISWLLLFYLLIVKPFIRSLILEVNGAAFKRPEFLWLNFRSPRSSPRFNPEDDPKANPRKALTIRPLDGRALSASMRAFTNTLIGQPIGVRAWRHLAQALIRHSLGGVTREDPDEDLDLEGLGAMQMHHSRQTGLMVYGRQNSAFSKIGSELQEAQIEFS